MSQRRDNDLIYVYTGEEKVNLLLINHYLWWRVKKLHYSRFVHFQQISKHVTQAFCPYLYEQMKN